MNKRWNFTGTTPSGVQKPYFPEGFWQAVLTKVEDAKPKDGEVKGFWVSLVPAPSTGLDAAKHEARVYCGYADDNGITMGVIMAVMGWTKEQLDAISAQGGFDFDPVTKMQVGTVVHIECQPDARTDPETKKKYHNTNVFWDLNEWNKRRAEFLATRQAAGVPAPAGTGQVQTQAAALPGLGTAQAAPAQVVPVQPVPVQVVPAPAPVNSQPAALPGLAGLPGLQMPGQG